MGEHPSGRRIKKGRRPLKKFGVGSLEFGVF
jgi:hypothetical protein